MKFLIIHNTYSKIGGEESVVKSQCEILRAHGHQVIIYERSYHEIANWKFGKISSLFSALYNRRSVRQIKTLIKIEKPDVALIHNLYPVISPAILPILKRHGIRTVMTLHNFRLICPIGLFFRDGKICELCGQSKLREWNCATHRCQKSTTGSIAYSMRGYWARTRGYYIKNIDLFCALSDFQLQKLSTYGVPTQRMAVVENPIHFSPYNGTVERERFVGFVGRFSPEKGSELLKTIAKMLPEIQFKVAGDVMTDIKDTPDNIEFVGFLDREGLDKFYRSARIIISTSICYETFGLVIAEAMAGRASAIVPKLAAMPDLVDNGRVGLTYTVGRGNELSEAIMKIMDDDELFSKFSSLGAEYIVNKYSHESYYNKLYSQIELISKNQ